MAGQLDHLGRRLRAARLRRGLSLRGLARDLGVSASMVSQVENGRVQPSVSTLYAITTALGVPIGEMFEDAGPCWPSGTPSSPVASSADVAQPDGPVARVGGRQVLRLDSGVTWERLGALSGATDFLLVTYLPGGTSSCDGLDVQHAGSEHAYLLTGELVLTLGTTEHRIRSGDAVAFASATPHRYRNEGTVPATGVWFVTGP
jgi:DNA-binding XRE family transcriptional regulator/mannose-6-phosphate isomerase-like protein (cupin superfamily)